MADESSGAGAVATLSADTRPYEKALDRAANETKKWGETVKKYLSAEQMWASVGRFDMMKGQLESFSKMTSDQIGSKLGAGIGATLGNAVGMALGGTFGGPVGVLLGGTIGEQLGSGLLPALQKQLTSSSWLNDITTSFSQIGDVFKGMDLGEFFRQPIDKAWDQVKEKAGEVWGKVEELGLKSLFRLQQGIDLLWASVREPAAAAANWLQQILQKVGLVDEGTLSWGDSLLMIQDVGRTVIESIGYGLGWLEGWFIKIGGVIGKYLIAPLTEGLGQALSAAALGVRMLVTDPNMKIGLAALGVDVDGLANGLDAVGSKLQTAGKVIGVAADEMSKMDPLQQAEFGKMLARRQLARGKELVARDAPPPAPPAPVPLSTTQAILEGTKEAANLRARSMAADTQLKALERVAANGAEQVKQGDKMIDLLSQVARQLGDSATLKPF